MKPSFRVVPLAASLASTIRSTRRDAAGRAVLEWRDGERHQCRACLELSKENETVLLASLTPFETVQPYAETGPVFVHERDCAFSQPADAWPAEFPRSPVLRAYSADDRIVDAALVADRPVEDAVRELLAREDVAYLHARNAAYGCYMFRVERA
jgi:hypothetical protein